MFISARKYHNVTSVDEVRRVQEFLPVLRQNPDFKGYYLIDRASPESGNIITLVSMFDSCDAALAPNDAAKHFVKYRLAGVPPEPAQAVGGEAIARAQA
jgi:hypothetical protein